MAFGLSGEGAGCALAATLLVGTPTLSLIGGLAAALTLGRPPRRRFAGPAGPAALRADPDLRRRRGRGAGDGRGLCGTHLAILAALALVALATTPWAMAAALRQAGE